MKHRLFCVPLASWQTINPKTVAALCSDMHLTVPCFFMLCDHDNCDGDFDLCYSQSDVIHIFCCYTCSFRNTPSICCRQVKMRKLVISRRYANVRWSPQPSACQPLHSIKVEKVLPNNRSHKTLRFTAPKIRLKKNKLIPWHKRDDQ